MFLELVRSGSSIISAYIGLRILRRELKAQVVRVVNVKQPVFLGLRTFSELLLRVFWNKYDPDPVYPYILA